MKLVKRYRACRRVLACSGVSYAQRYAIRWMTGSALGGLYFGGTEAGSFQAGAQVQGLTPSPVYSGTLQQQSFPTAVDGTLDVKGYFGVTLGVQLLGSDTIHVDPRAYAELQANTSATPWWTLSVGDEADAGLTVSFLGLGSRTFPRQSSPSTQRS